MKTVLILLILLFLIFPSSASGQIKITEVYPNPLSGENEMIELENIATQSTSLAGWYIQDQLSSPSTIFTFSDLILEPGQLYVASISGKLNNSGDGVALYDGSNLIIDSMNYSSSISGQSWSLNYDTGFFEQMDPSLGQKNSPSVTPASTPTPSGQAPLPTPAPSQTPVPTPTPVPTDYSKLTITEIMSCPDSSSEWFRFYNNSNQDIEFNGFSVVDQNSNTFKFSETLGSNESKIIKLNQAILNNSGDSLSLFDQDGTLLQNINLPACKYKGVSFTLIDGAWRQNADDEQEEHFEDGEINNTEGGGELHDSGSDNESSLQPTPYIHKFSNKYLKNMKFAPSLLFSPSSSKPIAKLKLQTTQLEKWPIIFVILGGILIASGGMLYFYDFRNNTYQNMA